MIIIGELINASRKAIKAAIERSSLEPGDILLLENSDLRQSEDGLEGIGQNGVAVMPAAFALSGPQLQVTANLQALRQIGQRLAPHQAGAQSAEFAFPGLRVTVEQFRRDDAPEQCVAEELQSLVVPAAGAAMSQCLLQEVRIVKRVAKRFCQGFRRTRQRDFTRTSL